MSTVAAVVVQEEGHSPIYVFYIDGKPVGGVVGERVEWNGRMAMGGVDLPDFV